LALHNHELLQLNWQCKRRHPILRLDLSELGKVLDIRAVSPNQCIDLAWMHKCKCQQDNEHEDGVKDVCAPLIADQVPVVIIPAGVLRYAEATAKDDDDGCCVKIVCVLLPRQLFIIEYSGCWRSIHAAFKDDRHGDEEDQDDDL